jgi:hypothetical protein
MFWSYRLWYHVAEWMGTKVSEKNTVTGCFSETVVPMYQAARCLNPQDHSINVHLTRKPSISFHVLFCRKTDMKLKFQLSLRTVHERCLVRTGIAVDIATKLPVRRSGFDSRRDQEIVSFP